MVKNTFAIIIILILITGCTCYRGPRTEFGFPRREIKPFDNFNNNYTLIDTTSIYKLKINFFYISPANGYSYYDKADNNSSPNISYYKFYPDGKLGLFVIAEADTASLTRESFNPKKAKMGYYTFKDGTINTKIVTDGNCAIYISKKTGTVKGDTLIMDQGGHGSIYVKSKIPYSYLNWKPDW